MKDSRISLGKVKFKNFNEFIGWCETESADDWFSLPSLWTNKLYKLQGQIPGVNVSAVFDRCLPSNRKEYYVELLQDIHKYMNMYEPSYFNLLYQESDDFTIINFGDIDICVPYEFLDITMYEDYYTKDIQQIRKSTYSRDALNSSASVPVLQSISMQEQESKIYDVTSEISCLQAKEQSVKNSTAEELQDIKSQIDKLTEELESRRNALLNELDSKMQELKSQQEELKNQLYMIESEIYAVRCYTGEVINFLHLRSGAGSDPSVPLTIFQKFRFLDEELGKLCSLYDFDFSDIDLFETLLKHREDVVDLFCPNSKCISIIRISQDNQTYQFTESVYGSILKNYTKYHGRRIGILIRDGDNVWLGWTDDEDKINLQDNLFFTPEDERTVESVESASVDTVQSMVSRYFILQIIRGVLDRKLLELDPSDNIVWSTADAWISDNKYGSLETIIKRVNASVKIGDPVLSLISGGDGYLNMFSGYHRQYNRSRDYSSRTHDVYICENQIYRINLVEEGSYYVSLKKSYNPDVVYYDGRYHDRKREARANFEIYKSEFINLTFMNSTWVEHLISSRNLGNVEGNYSRFIRYFKTMLEFLKSREKDEYELISKYVLNLDSIPDWPARLSEWKLKKDIHNFTDYRAKQFSKYLKG